MSENEAHQEHLESVRRQRAYLIDQIAYSQHIIERSQELLKRIDKILEKSAKAP